MIRLHPILLILSFVFGCDSGVEIEQIPISRLYSVSAIISPQDSVFTLYLYKGIELSETVTEATALVPDANVTISDEEGRRDSLRFNAENDRYEGERRQLSIEAGRRYFLQVETSSNVVLTSACIIPPVPGKLMVAGSRVDEDYYFTASWENIEDHKYYLLSVDADGTIQSSNNSGTISVDITAHFFEDIKFPLSTQSSFNSFDGYLPFAYSADNAKLIVILTNIEQDLYRYFNTYQKYDVWDSNNTGNFFPSFQEVQPVYSNIDGGVGIFAGANSTFFYQSF